MEYLTMQRDISWLWGALWLFLLGGALISFSNQTEGAITQKCSSGFYREWTGPHRGQCVPCSCNGLSNECDSHTGNCVNCQFNTDGDRCERCREGYYGDAAQRTCHACPCPFTWNNFALTCWDIESGVVECLCKPGYHGSMCDRCASGYYGNPMIYGGSCQLSNCSDGTSNMCDSLTGKCDSCTDALLNDLEMMDDELAWLKQQLHSISQGAVSLPMFHSLEADISETKILVGTYTTAVNGLDPKFEQLETEVDVIREDLSRLIVKNMEMIKRGVGAAETDGKTDPSQDTLSDSGKVLENVNGIKLNAEDLASEAEALFMTLQNLIKQLSEVKPGPSITLPENEVARMVEEAQRIVQEMRGRGCTAQRKTAGNDQEEAHKLLDLLGNNMTLPLDTNQTAVSLMTSGSSLVELARMLSDAENTVGRTQGLNLKSGTTLQDLLKLQAQLEKEQGTLLPMTEMTKDQLRNTADIVLMLEESKEVFEHLAAQPDGAKVDLIRKLNNISQAMEKEDVLIKAEEHADELNRLAGELQLVVHNATNSSSDLLSAVVGKGAHNSIINIIEKAEVAANQSKVAADVAYKDVEQGGLVNRTEGLKDNANHLLTEATQTQSYRKTLSGKVDSCKGHLNKQKKKEELIRMEILAVDDLKKIKRDDIEVLLDSAKSAASASNDTVSNVTDRLRNINQEAGRIRFTNASANIDDMLSDAAQALRTLNKTLPTLKDNLALIQDLSKEIPPSGNMTESIRRIKEVIQETRNFVNRLSIATTFNGRGHIELRPPSNLEDVKAFTAIDLILNRHQNNPSQADHHRKRRQDKHKDDLFVFYLGNKDPSGDYVGMAVRSNILVCVYKLGGVVHEVETSQITTTSDVNSTDFDRVVFRRVYQDAEVNITQNFTSLKPIRLSPKRNLPNTVVSVLNLDPESVVFYVGGYPEDFIPPVALRYPRYRGAMKLSLVNDNPVCLFNYKYAVDIGEKQPYVKVPQSEVSDYYEGTGYRMGLTSNPEKKKQRLFKFHIDSRETNALLFYIGNEDSFFCVFMERGRLVLRGRQASQELRAQSGKKVSLFNKYFIIEMDDKFTVHYGPKQISTDYIKTVYRSYYIGGLPTHLRERENITAPPLRGCVDHLTADSSYVQYNKTIGVSVGCPVSLLGVREATFKSILSVESLGLWDKPPVIVSLGFRSTEKHGALLRTSYQDSTSVHDFNLSLVDGYVVFYSGNYTLKSHNIYNDGSWHYVSAVKNPSGLELSIDNVDVGQPHHIKPLELALGGKNFKGCIANLYTRRPDLSFIPADLSSFSQKGDVVHGTCSLNRPPQTTLLAAPLHQRPQRNKNMQAQTGVTASRCRGQPTYYGEYKLSQPDSWLSYNVPPDDLNYRPHFSLEVRTRSSKGLLFHVAGKGGISLLALFMANGKIKLSLGQNRVIHHKKKSNDGNWHRVVFSVERNTFHLLVDGFRVTDGHLSGDEGSSLDLQNPVYLGGDPLHKISKGHFIPKTSVIGCIRDLKLNEIEVGGPVAIHGASPCFDGPSETGTYFGGAGGHIVLDKYFTVGSHFELAFELRPQRLTGLLFHVRSHKTSLDVFLMENKVGVKVNDGSGTLSVSVTPHQNLCDGKFHAVAVSKQHNVIKLVVDSVSEQKVGRSLSTSYSTTLGSLHIGGISGTTKRNRVPVSSSFLGCLRNMSVSGSPVAFEAASSVVGPVNINKCPAD